MHAAYAYRVYGILALHGLFHRNKHIEMIEHATKKRCFMTYNILFHDKNVYIQGKLNNVTR